MILRQDKIGFAAGNITPATGRATWQTDGADKNVAGQLVWANFGNGHSIIDASGGVTPDGVAINNSNPVQLWSPTRPVLMGWNGTDTYGVRVDSARVSDVLTTTTGAAPVYACRAWVNFNGTGVVAIRSSSNVSSITDNATGDYTVNFTTAMPDANYSAVVGAGMVGAGAAYGAPSAPSGAITDIAWLRLNTRNTSGAFTDSDTVCVSIFR